MPALPRDAEDDDRDDDPDDRIGNRSSESHDRGTCQDAEAHKTVDSSVAAVCYQRRAIETPAGTRADLSGDLVPEESDDACSREPPQVRERVRVDEAQDRLDQRDDGAHEDRQDHSDPRPTLAAGAAEEERKTKRNRRQGIAEVVDEIGE